MPGHLSSIFITSYTSNMCYMDLFLYALIIVKKSKLRRMTTSKSSEALTNCRWTNGQCELHIRCLIVRKR